MSLRRDNEYYEDRLNSVSGNGAYLEAVDDPSSSDSSDVSSDEEENKLDTKNAIVESEGDMFASEDEERMSHKNNQRMESMVICLPAMTTRILQNSPNKFNFPIITKPYTYNLTQVAVPTINRN